MVSNSPGTRLAFPEGFLWGCAGAAHQVEGGNHNDWTDVEGIPGAIKDGSSAQLACDHYRRYPDDLRDLAELGQNAHRFSVEWSRIEPEEGRFDREALEHYSDVVDTCRTLGLEPMVTLHHFTLPRWLAARGGVTARDAPARFARFAALCSARLGDRVRWWLTINEPAVLAVLGRLYGEWPPRERSLPSTVAAMRGLLRMHGAAAAAIRAAARRDHRTALISVAHHVHGMLPADPHSPLDRAAAAVPDLVFNRWWLRACRSGRMLPPLGRGERVPGVAGSLDYIGLNYYSDDLVRFDWRRPTNHFARQAPDPSKPLSTFGWAIDPAGLERVLVEIWEEHAPLPIVITENGVADRDDELRPRFLVEHLAAVHAAIRRGVDVRGYMLWTAMDNFEWAEGYGQRFGIIAVDRDTMERRRKPSALVYERICRTNAVEI